VYGSLSLICLYYPEVPHDPPQLPPQNVCLFNFKQLLNNAHENARIILGQIYHSEGDYSAALCGKVVTFMQSAAFWSGISGLSGPKRFSMDD
jgi:hypothetical protein